MDEQNTSKQMVVLMPLLRRKEINTGSGNEEKKSFYFYFPSRSSIVKKCVQAKSEFNELFLLKREIWTIGKKEKGYREMEVAQCRKATSADQL